MQLNKLFQLSMEEALGLSRQQVSKFVDRASSRVVPSGHGWHPFDELVRKPGLVDVHRMVRIDDLWGAAALLVHGFREQFPGRFFIGAGGDIGGLLAGVCPEAEADTAGFGRPAV